MGTGLVVCLRHYAHDHLVLHITVILMDVLKQGLAITTYHANKVISVIYIGWGWLVVSALQDTPWHMTPLTVSMQITVALE